MKKALFIFGSFLTCFLYSSQSIDVKGDLETQGFVWIPGFFSEKQVTLIDRLAKEIHVEGQKTLSLPKGERGLIVVPESKDPMQLCRTEDMLANYPDLEALITETISTYLKYMLGEPYAIFKDKLNFKWPTGGAFPPHQDFPAFEKIGPREHITAMICIDPATEENGCLKVAKNWRGTFADDPTVDQIALEEGKAILPYIVGGKEHGTIKPEYTDQIEWLSLKTAPGDLVLFTSYVPHYSAPNQSKLPRRAMFLTFNKLSEGEFRKAYYYAKRNDPENPMFHFGTPTHARTKE